MLTDSELVTLCLSNDQRAYQQLYQQYSRPVFNTCLRICGDPESARDILQEVFIVAFKKMETFDVERSFKAWLQGIAINMALTWVRKEKNKILLSSISFEIPEAIDDSEEEEWLFSVETIIQTMQELSWIQKLIFNLHALEELTHRDIAEKLEIPESTVRSHYARARKNILANLK